MRLRSDFLRSAVAFDIGRLNRSMVPENDADPGSVNANRDRYEAAADVLGNVDRAWGSRLISRRVAGQYWADALIRRPDDVKVIIDFTR